MANYRSLYLLEQIAGGLYAQQGTLRHSIAEKHAPLLYGPIYLLHRFCLIADNMAIRQDIAKACSNYQGSGHPHTSYPDPIKNKASN